MRRQAIVQKDWVLQKPIETFVTEEVDLKPDQATRLVSLFKQGCESAYIARYRGDVHGGLAPDQIRKAMDAYDEALDLNKKVSNALTTITAKVEKPEEKEVVAERLKQCEDVQEVGEISKEFSKGVRKTKATIAKELGLEPSAIKILQGQSVNLKALVSKEMNSEAKVKDHLKVCLADMMNKDENTKKLAASLAKLESNGKNNMQVTAKLTTDAEKKKEEPAMQGHLKKYQEYIGKSWNAKNIRDHQVSALNRAAEEGILTWSVDLPVGDAKQRHPYLNRRVDPKMKEFYDEALHYSVTTYFVPKVQRAAKKHLTTLAITRSIQLFGENIEQLFQQKGIHGKYVIALDPGTMIKTAFLKPDGSVIEMDQFAIRHTEFDNKGRNLLKKWATQTNGKDLVFAVGNGSNTYNTQSAVSRMIESREFFPIEVGFCVVPEHGASKYSCTAAATEEFGEKADIKQISAVSIGRRLIDPMSEYVKIEPQHLGKGQYQLSVDEKLLKTKLSQVVRDRVSLIGADLNQASKHLLKQICGLNEATASGIVKYREQNEKFRSREELKKVRGIGAVVFQQCSGFLTVTNPESEDSEPPKKRQKKSAVRSEWDPLDATIVHPEDYATARKLLSKLNVTVEQICNGAVFPITGLSLDELKIVELLRMKSDLKPPPPILKKVRAMRDLAIGQRFTGVVSNKTDFGVFVDIGVEKDGLAHISAFRKGGKKHWNAPNQQDCLPAVGDILEFIVNDIKNDRISLKPVNV